MSRALRIEYPGAFYHVMHRGNAGEDLFKSPGDREKFIEYISKAVDRYELKIHTYCLMTNHYHLLIETPQPNLSQAVKWVNVSYAAYFNRKWRRVGHLFQGRFKAILVDADEYLKHLSRYIHLNPMRANLVEHPREYKWSSYPIFSGYVKPPPWLETNCLLSLFGKDRNKAKQRYRNFVEIVQLEKVKNPADEIVGGVILGGADFVSRVKDTFLKSESESKEKPQLKSLSQRLKPEDLTVAVCNAFNCERKAILRKGKKRNLARDIAIYLSREMTGESGVSLGEYFGGISGAGITVRHNHIVRAMKDDRKLEKRINKLRKRIINN